MQVSTARKKKLAIPMALLLLTKSKNGTHRFLKLKKKNQHKKYIYFLYPSRQNKGYINTTPLP